MEPLLYQRADKQAQICETLKKDWHGSKVPEIFIEQLRKAGLPI